MKFGVSKNGRAARGPAVTVSLNGGRNPTATRLIAAAVACCLGGAALAAASTAAASPGAAQSADQGVQNGSSTTNSTTQKTLQGLPKSKLGTVTIVATEEAVATISRAKVEHVSPASSLVDLFKNVPGFNVLSTGAGNMIASDNVFTLDGFNSDQVGSTFDGVPLINTFLGGIYGEGDDYAVTPLTANQIEAVQVFSGANTPAQTSIDSLGGTINFEPRMPGQKFGVQVTGNGGSYTGYGSTASEFAQIDSGAIASLGGFRVLASIEHMHVDGYQQHTGAYTNSFYLSAVQPTESGQVSFVFASNNETANMPNTIPIDILQQNGKYWNYPTNIDQNWDNSRENTAVLSLKSLLNPVTIGEVKFFYNGTSNDRTGYGNGNYPHGYLGYRLPTGVKTCGALDGYLSSGLPASAYPNVYNCAVAEQMFGTAALGTQYQRYVNNYYNTGAMTKLVFLLPDNTVTFGADAMFGEELSEEAWYGSMPVPMTDGYNMAWLEHDARNQYDAYIQDDMSLLDGKLHIHPGVKYNYVPMYSNDDAGYFYVYPGEVHREYVFSEPSIGVEYNITHTSNVYVNFGRTYKPPDISALYSTIGTSQSPAPVTVEPEYVNSIDAGFRYNNRYGKFTAAVYDRKFQKIFSYNYNDFTGITVIYNSGTAEYKGFTLGADMPLPEHLALEANFGYTDAKYTSSFAGVDGTVTAGQWRPDVPEDTGNLGLEYSYGAWYAALKAHLVGAQYLAYSSGSTSSTRLPAYTTVDANAAYEWKIHSYLQDLKVELHADNLLNNRDVLYGYVEAASKSTPAYELAQYQPPFFVGVSVTADFGAEQ